ncbi:hypothetical protein EB796_003898 [Bugula neritina]|uniref:Uncharacterized protein n=1 Tax=Bugula neritina TaxID=10212 RepID=A0A7J7KJK8_BUGNE|nr:hypothetical protein EB796_003898 [Bugula neritina]
MSHHPHRIMEESPRWLLSQGRTEEALAYFKKSARINKVEFPENLHVYLEYQPKVEGNALSLFKTPNLRHKSLVVCTLWFSVSIVFFGMTFNAGNLAGNIFTNNYLLQASGILEFFGIWYIRLGRRLAISSAFLIACLVSAVIPIFATYGMQAGVITMSMVGKLFIETNFEMIYVVTAELYPTTARVTALGLGSSIARAGGALSPYLILSDDVWKSLPYVIFGVIALAAGLVATLLPETMNKELPDSLHQVETENLVNHVLCRVKQTTEKESEEEKTMETVAV